MLTHVTEVAAGTADSLLFGDAEQEERLRQEEAEKAAQQRETFQLLYRLLGYMGRQWKYYGMAFGFLFCYSLSELLLKMGKSVSTIILSCHHVSSRVANKPKSHGTIGGVEPVAAGTSDRRASRCATGVTLAAAARVRI